MTPEVHQREMRPEVHGLVQRSLACAMSRTIRSLT